MVTPTEELQDAGQEKLAAYLHKPIKNSITAIDADVKRIEENMRECLKRRQA